MGNSHRFPSHSFIFVYSPLELFFIDLWGPSHFSLTVISETSNSKFVTLNDNPWILASWYSLWQGGKNFSWDQFDLGLTLLHYASLPLQFWDYAFTTTVYLINRLPTTTLKFVVPFVALFNKEPDYHFLKTFGCACFPLLRPSWGRLWQSLILYFKNDLF